MKLRIKNMVSERCKAAVRHELKKMNLHFGEVNLGEVDVKENLTAQQREELKANLLQWDLELMNDKQDVLIEEIKTAIALLIRTTDDMHKIRFRDFLSEQLHRSYTYLQHLFSKVQGIPIQQFIKLQKIEHVKELLLKNELTVKEIAYQMNYSSVAHLSNQFKLVTGLSPMHFKQLTAKKTNQVIENATPAAHVTLPAPVAGYLQ